MRRRGSGRCNVAALRSARLDELEIELDRHHIAQHRAEGAEAEAEVLTADLAGGLEPGVAGPVEER